jgi:hypothetical protein
MIGHKVLEHFGVDSKRMRSPKMDDAWHHLPRTLTQSKSASTILTAKSLCAGTIERKQVEEEEENRSAASHINSDGH